MYVATNFLIVLRLLITQRPLNYFPKLSCVGGVVKIKLNVFFFTHSTVLVSCNFISYVVTLFAEFPE